MSRIILSNRYLYWGRRPGVGGFTKGPSAPREGVGPASSTPVAGTEAPWHARRPLPVRVCAPNLRSSPTRVAHHVAHAPAAIDRWLVVYLFCKYRFRLGQ